MFDVLLDTPSPETLHQAKFYDSATTDDTFNKSSSSTVVLSASAFLSKSIDSALDLNQSLTSGTKSRLGSNQ